MTTRVAPVQQRVVPSGKVYRQIFDAEVIRLFIIVITAGTDECIINSLCVTYINDISVSNSLTIRV